MSLSASEEQKMFNALLQERGFDFQNPDPVLAWEIFKECARAPLTNQKIQQIYFEFYHDEGRDNELWIEYGCGTEVYDGGVGFGCLLLCDVPTELIGINKTIWWNSEEEQFRAEKGEVWTLKKFFEAVEQAREFQMCMKLSDWTWED